MRDSFVFYLSGHFVDVDGLMLLLRHDLQIASSIVHCSTIFMMDDKACRAKRDFPMHSDPAFSVIRSNFSHCVISAK